MGLKFFLNKIIKIDNVENYTLESLKELKKCYDDFLEDSGGTDPDFPMIPLGTKGKSVKGTNVFDIFGDDEDFHGFIDEDKLHHDDESNK